MKGIYLDLAIALPGGILLGLLFFGGLRITVNRLAQGRLSLWSAAASYFVRMALLAAGFWWIGAGEWRRYLFCLLGVLVAPTLLLMGVGDKITKV